MSQGSDDDLFAQAMSEVQAIKPSLKVLPLQKHHREIITKLEHNIEPYQAQPQSKHDQLSQSGSPWTLRADGISSEVLKKLGQGQPEMGKSIDLHGMSRDQALQVLEQQIHQAIQHQTRVVGIIHGRGNHSKHGIAILKESVYQWLQHGPLKYYILAVTPQANSAGGSCLILLRRDKRK
ncbi:MAG: Smr/MutS family protein [Mariprofundaceae bacterium]